MNKKFTTFLTAMLVLLGFASASAQNPILRNQVPHAKQDGYLIQKLNENENDGFFQIAWEQDGVATTSGFPNYTITNGYNYVLGVLNGNEVVLMDLDTITSSVAYATTFWCVTVSQENQSQQPKYDFVNRATGQRLQVAMEDLFTLSPTITLADLPVYGESSYVPGNTPIYLDGNISGWSLSAQYDDLINGSGRMYSTYIPNRVVGFTVENQSTVPTLGTAIANFNDAETIDNILNDDFFATFKLRSAGVIRLDANAINTLLEQQAPDAGVKLSFNPDVLANNNPTLDFSNPFVDNYFIAVPNNNFSLMPGDDDDYLVNIRLKSSATTYLKVDTVFHNNTGLKFLKFAWDDLSKHPGYSSASSTYVQEWLINGSLPVLTGTNAVYNSNGLVEQYYFLFTYDVTYDKLFIQVKSAFDKEDGTTFKATVDGTTVSPVSHEYEYPYVWIQDLETDARVISVNNAQNTTISFGFDMCNTVASNKTSVADGLYFIKNASGQYLASPIHFNGSDARWETIDGQNIVDQNPSHMPAYQWVVLKDRNYTDDVRKISRITAYNREFPNLILNIQLSLDANSNVYVSSYLLTGFPGSTEVNLSNSYKLNFVQITDSAVIKDPYLGYRKFSEDSLLVNKYQFNYLHQFNLDKYLAVGGSKDSALYAADNASRFILESLKRTSVDGQRDSLVAVEYTYGYDATGIQDRIKGLARLKRTPYAIVLNNEGTFGRTTEDRYAIGNHKTGINDYDYPSDTTYVYFKENNHYNGKHYFAIVEFDFNNRYGGGAPSFLPNGVYENIINHVIDGNGLTSGNGTTTNRRTKAGIADNMNTVLKVQDLYNESRTTAFAITNDESPLYRRFNSADENVNNDTTVVLRFVEGYRKNEYLQVENNSSFTKKGIDYLGIWTEDRAKGGISFYVDTAWVGRGAGYIKPQYLILIERETYPGSEAVACIYDHNHGYDANGNPLDKWSCPHATPAIPGYTRAKYLVNFGGFTSNKLTGRNAKAKVLPIQSETDKEFDDTYRWRGYDRAGFLQGIHIQDTLIILNEKYSKYAVNEQGQQLYALDKINMQDIKNDPLNAVFDLRYDYHKYVTWSMRYIDPEKAFLTEGKDKRFLMESMKRLNANEPDIAPDMAQWIKMQNGCLVLSLADNSYFDQMRESDSSTGGDDALIFDVEVGSESQIAVDNDDAVSANVVVIGGNGSVTVKNAANKTVVITNVLGQTIANTVVSSDNATISVPQGIVVVSVQGESAVKAIVK